MPPAKDDPRVNPLAEPSGSDYYTHTVHNDTYPAISPLSANLSGQSVFVAGASKGIGKAIAISYARAGASQIAIGARSDLSAVVKEVEAAATEAKRESPKVLPLNLDVTSKESVGKAAEELKRTFGGRLDILINNAGILGKRALVADANVDDWWDVWNVNLLGPFMTTRACLPLLLATSSPRIINVVSVGAHLTGPGFSAYQPSKLALVRFTDFLQAEYGAKGLTAISIHPGNIETGILDGIGGIPKGFEHVIVETVELAGNTVTYLTKEERKWLGGRYLNVTWDMPQLMEKEEEIVKGDKLKVRLVW